MLCWDHDYDYNKNLVIHARPVSNTFLLLFKKLFLGRRQIGKAPAFGAGICRFESCRPSFIGYPNQTISIGPRPTHALCRSPSHTVCGQCLP